MFVIRDTKIEAVRSLGICRKISASPYLRSAEIAVASARPARCLGNSWPSQSPASGRSYPFSSARGTPLQQEEMR